MKIMAIPVMEFHVQGYKICCNFVSLPWKLHNRYCHITDKETDESGDIFIIRKINSGMVWAAGPYL
jgi:hypothetical protein